MPVRQKLRCRRTSSANTWGCDVQGRVTDGDRESRQAQNSREAAVQMGGKSGGTHD
jgi:hypothetical protein